MKASVFSRLTWRILVSWWAISKVAFSLVNLLDSDSWKVTSGTLRRSSRNRLAGLCRFMGVGGSRFANGVLGSMTIFRRCAAGTMGAVVVKSGCGIADCTGAGAGVIFGGGTTTGCAAGTGTACWASWAPTTFIARRAIPKKSRQGAKILTTLTLHMMCPLWKKLDQTALHQVHGRINCSRARF